jgi:heat shock protein HslJ
MLGSYETDGERLRFGAAASTMMACPPPLDSMERSLSEVLSQTRAIRLAGHRLELLAEDGTTLAQLEAVYLR